jgi:hypothetical protein
MSGPSRQHFGHNEFCNNADESPIVHHNQGPYVLIGHLLKSVVYGIRRDAPTVDNAKHNGKRRLYKIAHSNRSPKFMWPEN